jgi:hypothetical protein
MSLQKRAELESLLISGEEYIKFKMDFDFLTSCLLFLSGKACSKNELRRLTTLCLAEVFRNLLHYAFTNNYRVFVFKEGGLFKRRNWYLEFVKR